MQASNFQLQTGHSVGLLIASTHLLYQRQRILVGSFQIATMSYAWGCFSPNRNQPDSLKREIHPFVCGTLLGAIIGIVPGIAQLLFQSWKPTGSFWEKSGFTIGTLLITSKAMDLATDQNISNDQGTSQPEVSPHTGGENNKPSSTEQYALLKLEQMATLSPVKSKRKSPPGSGASSSKKTFSRRLIL